MSTLFTQDYSRVLAIGIGSLGCRAARVGDEQGDESAAMWSAAHFDSTELIATGLERKLFLKMSAGPFAERSLLHSLNENAAMLEKCTRGRDTAILCGELSDPRAMDVLKALSTVLSDLNITVFALVIEPFAPNGEYSSGAIERQLAELGEVVPFVGALNPGMQNVSAGIAVRRVRSIAAERMAAAAECLAGALNAEPEHASQLKMLRGMHRAVYSAPSSTTRIAFDTAYRSFDGETAERIQVAIVSSASEMSFRETKGISQKLPAHAVFITTMFRSGVDAAECMLLSGPGQSSNVVSIDDAREFAMVRE